MKFSVEQSRHVIGLPIFIFLSLVLLFAFMRYYLDSKEAERRIAMADAVSEQVVNGLEVFSADRKRSLSELTRTWPSRHPNPKDWFHTHAASMKNVLPGIFDIWWATPDMHIQWSILSEQRDQVLGLPLMDFNFDTVKLKSEGIGTSFILDDEPKSFFAIRIDNNNPELGYVVAEFDLSSTLTALVGELISSQFSVMIKDGQSELVQYGEFTDQYTAVSREIDFADRTWVITIQTANKSIRMGEIVFYVGIVMSCLLCFFLSWQLRSSVNLSKSQRLYKAAGEAALDSMFVYEAIENSSDAIVDFKLTDLNKVASEKFDFNLRTPKSYLLSSHMKLLGMEAHFTDYLNVAMTGKAFEYQWHNNTGVSTAKWLKIQVVRANKGLAVTARDITTRYQNQQQLVQSEEKFRRLVDGLKGHFIYSVDASGNLSYLSSGVEEILGYSADDFKVNHKKYVEERSSEEQEFDKIKYLRHKRASYQITYRSSMNTLKTISYSDSPVYDEHGELLAIEGIGRDVTKDLEMQQKFFFQANHDQLTGLFNRYAFERVLQETIDKIAKEGIISTLCYIDMDKFKLVNDTCGHQAGDQLLRNIATILSQTLSERDLLSRVGGDEFCMILQGVDAQSAIPKLERLLKNVAAFRFSWEEKVFHIGASIGVVEIDQQRMNAVDLVKDADNACYTAKNNGRNQYYIYDSEDLDVDYKNRELELLSQIQKALDEGYFELHFQIIKSLDNANNKKRYEILLRMLGDDGELVSPVIFIPIAERYGLMPRIDQWVFENTLALLEEHPEHLNELEKCAINLSGASLNSPSTLQSIMTLLTSTSVPVEKLCFEITETSAVTNLVNAAKTIEDIRSIGCQFALDDFGAGMSSFTYLKNMDVDYVKIDGSFVKDMVNDKCDLATVKAIHDIASSMGKQTIAEFVGDEATEILLKQIGVNYAQGFAIGKPESFSQFLKTYKSHNALDASKIGT